MFLLVKGYLNLYIFVILELCFILELQPYWKVNKR